MVVSTYVNQHTVQNINRHKSHEPFNKCRKGTSWTAKHVEVETRNEWNISQHNIGNEYQVNGQPLVSREKTLKTVPGKAETRQGLLSVFWLDSML